MNLSLTLRFENTVKSVFVLFFLYALLIPSFAMAQNINTPTNFPDPNFRAVVERFMGIEPGGKFTAEQAGKNAGEIKCASLSIESVQGLQYFTNITGLYCENNNLTSLDVTANSVLSNLSVYNNEISSIDLTKNNSLMRLNSALNPLQELDVSQNPLLTELNCSHCELPFLDVTNNNLLQYLYCTNNDLYALDLSRNPELVALDCEYNKLNELNIKSNPKLYSIKCQNNQIKSISDFKYLGLLLADVHNNLLDCDDWDDVYALRSRLGPPNHDHACSIDGPIMFERGFEYTPQIGVDPYECGDPSWKKNFNIPENFPDPLFRSAVEKFMGVESGMGFTPEQASQRKGILDCSNKKIQSFEGLQYFTNLTKLDCSNCYLQQINFPDNLHLNELDCSNNKFSELDVSMLLDLTNLNCTHNELENLDLANNQKLSTVDCNNNRLKHLTLNQESVYPAQEFSKKSLVQRNNGKKRVVNIKSCTDKRQAVIYISNYSLKNLDCSINLLENLDISENENLINLNCSYNSIAALDISHNSCLGLIDCSYNNLMALDISHNPNLESICCRYNKLPELNVSDKLDLLDIQCDNNQIVNCTFFNNPLLSSIQCQNNQIGILDFSYNQNLSLIQCFNNRLTGIKVRFNENLTELDCSHNVLFKLNIDGNPILKKVNCSDNKIQLFEFTSNMQLEELRCHNNRIDTLEEIRLFPPTKILDVRNNYLTEVNWPDAVMLTKRIGIPQYNENNLLISGFACSPQIGIDPYNYDPTILKNWMMY